MKRLSIFLGAILAVILMASCSSNSPKAVAEKSVKCIADKDYNGYVDLLYFSEKDKHDAKEFEEGKQQLAALLKDKAEKTYSKKGGISSYEALNEEIAEDGKTANVKMKITYGNGTSEETGIKLRKDNDDNWKIDMGK